jgi:hypothetical protein
MIGVKELVGHLAAGDFATMLLIVLGAYALV